MKCEQCEKPARREPVEHSLWRQVQRYTGCNILCTPCIKKAISELIKEENKDD